FSDLKRSLRASVPEFLSATEKLRSARGVEDGLPRRLEQVFAQDVLNIERTAALNDERAVAQAARLIQSSGSVVVIGDGSSAAAARLLTHQLSVLGLRVS